MPLAKRSQKRAQVLLKATAHKGIWETKVRIRDISSLGALVECSDPPTIGTALRLTREDLDVACKVVWSGTDYFGVEFAEAIQIDTFLEAVGRKFMLSPSKHLRRRKDDEPYEAEEVFVPVSLPSAA